MGEWWLPRSCVRGMVHIGDCTFTPHASPTWRATVATVGVRVIGPSPRRLAAGQHPAERTFLRRMRNRIEALVGLIKGQHGLEHHGTRSWWGLVTRVAGVLAAFTLARSCLQTTLIASG